VIALLGAACTGGSSGTAIPAPSGGSATAAAGGGSPGEGSPLESAGGSASTRPSPGEGEFVNPVIARQNFADPFVLDADGTYYAYATNDGIRNISIARSDDLVHWEQLDDAMPERASWAGGRQDIWAPEVYQTPAGFVMYYTGRAFKLQGAGGSPQCVSVAVAEAPEGPFVDSREEQLACQPELGGSIDSTSFVDTDGTRYLIWKNDGNCCGIPTRFYMQQLTEDGLEVTGEVIDLGVVNDAAWELPVNSRIEAPTLWLQDGTYYLFFSGSAHDTFYYAVGYATSKTVTGPYKDAPENPILWTDIDTVRATGASGPGHQAIITDDDGELWMVYHAWDPLMTYRQMWIDRLTFEDGKAVVHGPTADPQPVP
jgi:beta-xylosidase